MKNILILILLCILWPLSGFSQLTDDFGDGNFTANPAWQGDATNFKIAAGQLQLNASGAGESYLSTANTLIDSTEWQFLVKLTFSPSDNNFVRIFLAANQPNLSGALNGYFLRIGRNGSSDGVELWEQSGSATKQILNTFVGKAAVNPNFRIKVTRNNQGLWRVLADTTGGKNFVEGGTVTDLTHTSTSFFGINCKFTGTNISRFYFDDFTIGRIGANNTPPVISNLRPTTSNTLELIFNKPLNPSTAQNNNNYLVNNSLGAPFSASIDANDSRKVNLNFSTAFPNGIENILTINNISDLDNNIITTPQSYPFTYVASFQAGYRDVVINEMLVDTFPKVGLPSAEYVELLNTTTVPINLNGFTFFHNTTPTTIVTDYVLAPKSYVILCNSNKASLFSGYPNVLGVALPSLTNSGATLSLRSNIGVLLDRVNYSLAWYNDSSGIKKSDGGWALEQINPFTTCTGSSNWKASTNPNGGTPGSQNAVFNGLPDTTPPTINDIKVISLTEIEIQFSRSMDSLSLLSGVYTFDQSLQATAIRPTGPEFTSARVTIAPAITEGSLYKLSISNVKSCGGNLLNNSQAFTFVKGFKPSFNQVIVSELLADESPKVGLPLAEFVELYNTTNKPLDLEGCSFAVAGNKITLPSITILPNEYIILCQTKDVKDYSKFGKTYGVSLPSLTNSGSTITLRGSNGNLIFSLTYADIWYKTTSKKDGGWSLEMIDVQNPCGGANNWAESVNIQGGTPGNPSSVQASNPDLTGPTLLLASAISPTGIKLTFNENLDSLTALNAQYIISNQIAISSISINTGNFNSVYITLSSPLVDGTVYTITVNNLTDCAGNLIANDKNKATFALPTQAADGDVILNEILFNPKSGGVDYVELYNKSNKFIDLQNWSLANASADTAIGTKRPIVTTPYTLKPSGYALLTTNKALTLRDYPRAMPYADSNFIVMTSMPSYPDDEGSVILLNAQDSVMQRFDYTHKYHFPLIDDENGVSLERIAFNAPTNQPDSWHSAASGVGYGTPGYRNSQAVAIESIAQHIKLEPKIFTPDEDPTHPDFTTIQYNFEQSGVMASITIFDDRGREVKKLVENNLLGKEGFYTWNGTNNNGKKVRVGTYVVFVETFDLNGKSKQYKETVVVGARF